VVDRDWAATAIATLETELQRSSDTHLVSIPIPGAADIDLYAKDESTHPTGSLKHRLARSLFLYGVCNGWIGPSTTVVEASSGSTAISEAYFARLLGLPFVAVMPVSTSAAKIALIEQYGGRCHLVEERTSIYDEADRLAAELGGHYMDQFTFAERATDWRGNNNIAESIFEQMQRERHPVPRWIVVGAGTGGTSATIGRFVRYRSFTSELCVVDPEGSVFAEHHRTGDASLRGPGSAVEGIGRPRVEPSFNRHVIDRTFTVPDVSSFAAMQVLSELLGRSVGGSTGSNFYGCIRLMDEMRRRGEAGSIVTLICDSGERYRETYMDDGWLRERCPAVEAHAAELRHFVQTGELVGVPA
jgi:cysteine synthase A